MEQWSTLVEGRWTDQPVDFKANPIVEVLWYDAYAKATDSWESEVDNKPIRVVSIGYVIHEDSTALTLASLVTENSIGHVLTITNGCIEDVRYFVDIRDAE